MNILHDVVGSLRQLREKRPLIHHITNYVSSNDCANITLGIGASPVMGEDIGEVAEMVSLAAALVLNIGTPSPEKIESMIVAGKQAALKKIPIVLDPVGAGATGLRLQAANRILSELPVIVVRGNLSEASALLGIKDKMQGVDCRSERENGQEIAQQLSTKLGCIVAVTGKTDIVANGSRICSIYNGDALLTGITGSGCMTTSLVASYCSVAQDPFIGTVAGVATMGIAGEMAARRLKPDEGLGSFRVRLFDAVSKLDSETLLRLINLN